MPNAVYQVILKDQAGAKVALFDEFAQVEYHRERNAPGWYKLQLFLPDDRAHLFRLDTQVEIWRKGDWAGADWELEFEGLHRRWFAEMNEQGQEYFESYGPGYLQLLARRIGMCWYHTPNLFMKVPYQVSVYEGYLKVVGTPPEVIAVMVVFEAGSLAAGTRPTPGLTIGPVVASGLTITEQLRNDNLLEVTQGLAEAYGLDIRIVGIGPGQFEFRVGPTLGVDRRVGNSAGNPPLVFSTAYGNMGTPQYVEDRLGEVNVVYVGGQGEEQARAILPLWDADRIDDSPWNRHEKFQDARDTGSGDVLRARGESALQEGNIIKDLSFEVVETEACKYGRDWRVGDLVTAIYRTIHADYRIEWVRIGQGAGGKMDTCAIGLVEYASA